jgi:hypothetical protein
MENTWVTLSHRDIKFGPHKGVVLCDPDVLYVLCGPDVVWQCVLCGLDLMSRWHNVTQVLPVRDI